MLRLCALWEAHVCTPPKGLACGVGLGVRHCSFLLVCAISCKRRRFEPIYPKGSYLLLLCGMWDILDSFSPFASGFEAHEYGPMD